MVPQFDHTQFWVLAAHIPDEFQLGFRVLIGVTVGTSGLTGKGCHTTVPTLPPKVDIRPALVVVPAGAADTIFPRVLH